MKQRQKEQLIRLLKQYKKELSQDKIIRGKGYIMMGGARSKFGDFRISLSFKDNSEVISINSKQIEQGVKKIYGGEIRLTRFYQGNTTATFQFESSNTSQKILLGLMQWLQKIIFS